MFLLHERSSEAPKLQIYLFISLIALLKSSDVNGFDHISSQKRCFTSKVWCVTFLIQNFIRFPDFFRIFLNLQIFPVLTLFLHRIIGLPHKYGMIFFSGISSAIRVPDFSGFNWIFPDYSDFRQIFRFFNFITKLMVYLPNL